MPSLAQEPPGTSVSKVHPSAFSQQPREGGGTGAKGSDWGRGQGAARKEPGRRSLVPVPEIVSLKSKKKKGGGGGVLTAQNGAAEVLRAFLKNHFRITYLT